MGLREYLYLAGFVLVIALLAYLRSASFLGKMGEKGVADRLERLAKKHPEYQVINNLLIPVKATTTQIDDVVVSPYGIFVIETKNYSGNIYGTENAEKWTEYYKRSSYQFRNPVKQNWGHVYALANYLRLDTGFFIPVVAFSGAASIKHVKTEMPVIYIGRILKFISGYTQERIDTERANMIYRFLLSNNLAGKEADKQHVKNVKNQIVRQNQALREGKCPKCGGSLVRRKGKYGDFYGCSNYPDCKYTKKI